MKAAVYDRYGPPEVVSLREAPKPEPKDDEILVRVRATTISTADFRARSLEMPPGFGLLGRLLYGISAPRKKILGTELAGDVEAVGRSVTAFSVGDAVFALTGMRLGGHAEYTCLRAAGPVVKKPPNLDYGEAAALAFGGTTALHFFRRGKLRSGERLLVVGASGCVGTAAVQIGKHFGAVVTGVTSSTNLELVRSLGAERVIDYTQEDFTKNGETYDLILDSTGTAPFSRCKGSLAEGGRLLAVLGSLGELFGAVWVSATSNKSVIAGPAGERVEDLRELASLAEAGVYKPVIDQRYPLASIVEAHRRVDSGRKRGSVVVTIDREPASS